MVDSNATSLKDDTTTLSQAMADDGSYDGSYGFRLYLSLLLPILMLVLLALWGIGSVQHKALKENHLQKQRLNLQLAKQLLEGELERPLVHLRSLSQLEEVITQTVSAPDPADLSGMVAAFRSVVTRNPDYAQVRWIGAEGRERVRVDRLRDGQLRVIPEQELQDKSDRYYFRDTMALQRGEIFLSPLDLNVEHGQVEVPYNPMLRMATRLFAEGGRSRGMLILNLSAAHLLQRFTEIESQGPGLCLLNNDGYWLESPHSDDEWGFMFGRKETFAQRYPSLWPRMAAQEQGEFDYEHGHWLWTSVYPAPAVNGPPMRWQIVTHLSPAVLKEIASQVWLPLLGGALLLLVLFAVLVWRLVRVRAEKHRAELALLAHRAIDASTRQANEQLEQRVQQRTAELAQANAELQRSNRELDEFAYIASHDLKEPLRGIHNYASFLQEDYAEQLDQQGRDFLQRMQRLAERQTELIDRLMAYSRVGRAEMDRAPVDLGRLLDDVEEDLRLFLQEQGAVIQRASTLPVVCCNRTRVGEVLQNLISNAVKYNDNTDKRIEVGCDESGRERVFYVRDNGIGIPPQHQEGVFRIFKRLHEQSRYGGGTGAGLTIVKKIIERHGGRIWLQSTPGQGASFYFTLGEPTT